MSAGTRTAPVEWQVGGGLDAPAWKKPLNYEYFCLCTFLSRKAAPGLPQGLFKEAIDTSHQNGIFPSIPRVSGVELPRGASSGKREQLLWGKGDIRKLPRQRTSAQTSSTHPARGCSVSAQSAAVLSRASFLGVSLLSTDTAKSPVLQQIFPSQL